MRYAACWSHVTLSLLVTELAKKHHVLGQFSPRDFDGFVHSSISGQPSVPVSVPLAAAMMEGCVRWMLARGLFPLVFEI